MHNKAECQATQLTDGERYFLACAVAKELFGAHREMIKAKGDDAKRAYAFDVIYANNTSRRLGFADDVDRLTLEQFAGMVHDAHAELERQEWQAFSPRIL